MPKYLQPKQLTTSRAGISTCACDLLIDTTNMAASIHCSMPLRSSASACFRAGRVYPQRCSRPSTVVPAAVHRVMSGASQPYPQKVRLDEGKAKAAELQSEQSKAQGGETKPSDAASKARVSSPKALWRKVACTIYCCCICKSTAIAHRLAVDLWHAHYDASMHACSFCMCSALSGDADLHSRCTDSECCTAERSISVATRCQYADS